MKGEEKKKGGGGNVYKLYKRTAEKAEQKN